MLGRMRVQEVARLRPRSFTRSKTASSLAMSSSRKYAGLPDLDIAPDIYETPELTDDASTRPVGIFAQLFGHQLK